LIDSGLCFEKWFYRLMMIFAINFGCKDALGEAQIKSIKFKRS